ncbi:MAG: thermonuclease family protein [Candidatus Altiarchaeota archaeon]|nr:thermonuclease family protein [Candidatus Altiarchaeota archaeon]
MIEKLLAIIGTLALMVPGVSIGQEFEVIDGDTLRVSGQSVRILGINTPERGKRCYNASKTNLAGLLNESVEMRRDIVNRDKYGRLLRHLFFEEVLIQDIMVREGYAKVLCIWPNNLYCESLMKSEWDAIKNGRGCLFTKSNNTCLTILDVECEGAWVKLKNNCATKEKFRGLRIENRGRDKLEVNELSLGVGETKTVHIRLFKNDAIYLFDELGLIDFETC